MKYFYLLIFSADELDGDAYGGSESVTYLPIALAGPKRCARSCCCCSTRSAPRGRTCAATAPSRARFGDSGGHQLSADAAHIEVGSSARVCGAWREPRQTPTQMRSPWSGKVRERLLQLPRPRSSRSGRTSGLPLRRTSTRTLAQKQSGLGRATGSVRQRR